MEAVLITGASHRAGSYFARALAGQGYFVWIHYHTHQSAALETLSCIEAAGGKGAVVSSDLADLKSVDEMVETISQTDNGDLTTLINNASVFQSGTIFGSKPEEWDVVMNTNLRAVWYLSRQFTKTFSTAKRIITIGDASVARGYAEHALYGLSKFALKYLTEQMAAAFAPEIYVNLLSPGYMLKGERESDAEWKERTASVLTDNNNCLQDVLNGLFFLMNDPGMTGSELIIDNGLHLIRNH